MKRVCRWFLYCTLLYAPYMGAGVPTSPGARLWDLVADYKLVTCTVDSKIDKAIESAQNLSCTFTSIESLLETECTTESFLDIALSTIELIETDEQVIQSKSELIDSKTDVILSALDQASGGAANTSLVDQIQQTICSKLDQTASQVAVIDSYVDLLGTLQEQDFNDTCTSLMVISSGVDAANSKVALLQDTASQVDDLSSRLDETKKVVITVDSTVDVITVEVASDFDGTFTMIDAIQQKICTSESTLAYLADNQMMVDLSGVFTVIDAIESKVDIIDSKLEDVAVQAVSIESKVNVIDTDITQINQKSITIESVVDELGVQFSALESLSEVIDMAAMCVNSTSEILNSQLPIIESKVCVIESKTDAVADTVSANDSIIEAIQDQVVTVESKVDILDSTIDVLDNALCTIDSKVDVSTSILDQAQNAANQALQAVITVESKVDILGSLLDVVDQKAVTIASTLDSVESKADQASDSAYTIESYVCALASSNDAALSIIDDIDNTVQTIDSKVDEISGEFTSAFDSVCTIESQIVVVESKTDAAVRGIRTIDSTLDELSNDFEQTWTVLAVIESKACTIQTLSQAIESKVDALGSSLDFTGVFTALDALEMKVCTIDSKVDAVNSALESMTIEQDIQGTYTVIEAITDKACTIVSKVEEVNSNVDVVQLCFGTPIVQADLPLTISTSGKYYIAEQLSAAAGTNGITISTANVTIDFLGRTLDGTSDTSNVGIVVSTGVSGATIMNGTIRDTGDAAIQISASCDSVVISNMSIIETSSHGIQIDSAANTILIDDCRVTGCSGNQLSVINATDVTVQESLFNTSGMHGVYMQDCSRVCLIDCIANNNTDSGFTFTTNNDTMTDQHKLFECKAFQNGVNGIFLVDTDDSVVQGCICRDNTGVGIRLHGCLNVQVSENISAGNTQQGILLATGTSRNTTDCYIAANTLSLNQVAGADVNFQEAAGNGPNSVVGNFALGANSLVDYVAALTYINQVGMDQGTAFSGTFPTKWYNIASQT